MTRKPRRAALFALLSGVNAGVVAALAVAGCLRYTSLGIDSDRRDGPVLRRAYYRLQWPGDGTFRVVWGENHERARAGERPMAFDLAGRFLLPPRREPAAGDGHFWRRAGFDFALRTWRSGERGDPEAASGALPYLGLVSVPGIVPPALALVPVVWARLAARRASRFASPLDSRRRA